MATFNRRANYEYELTGESVEAGIQLKGIEAKAIREGHLDLSASFVKILEGEAYLVNANVPAKGAVKYEPTRTRKLLLHKKEILSLLTKMKQLKLQAVPVKVYNKGRLVKLQISLGKPKRKFEKKDSIKRKDIDRDIERELKESV